MRTLAAALVVAALVHSTMNAEESPRLPDPATILVPDLSESSRPEVVRGGTKYFFFHREGVTFEEAHADFSECFLFLQPNDWESVHINRFVPWESQPGRGRDVLSNPYGLVGIAIAAMVEGSLQHGDYQAKMRACMEPRGYVRRGVAKDIWRRVTGQPPEQSIAILSKIASGPAFGTKVTGQ